MSEMDDATSKGVTTSLVAALFIFGANCALQTTVGGISLTITRKEHVTVLLPASWAVKTTVEVPIGNAEPDVCPVLCVTVRFEEQLSVKIGEAKLKTLLH